MAQRVSDIEVTESDLGVDAAASGRPGGALDRRATSPVVVPSALRRHEIASAFRFSAATAAAHAPGSDEALDALVAAGRRLVELAAAGDARSLADLLRPDPERAPDTFTVACYRIGDLAPSALRDFPAADEAVRLLAACDDASHVAAELVVSNDDGARWTAASRTGDEVRFALPPTGPDSPDPVVARRWDDRLVAWAVDPEQAPTQAPVAPVAASPDVVDTTARDAVVAELTARVTSLEAQLASGVAGGRWEQLGRQVDAMLAIWRRTRR